MSPNSSMRALQCIKTAGELGGGFKENSEGISHPLTLHTSLIAATSTGFALTLQASDGTQQSCNVAKQVPSRSPQDRLQCRRPDPPPCDPSPGKPRGYVPAHSEPHPSMGHRMTPVPLLGFLKNKGLPFTALCPARPIPASTLIFLPSGPSETPPLPAHYYSGPDFYTGPLLSK
jgi:hypothetical protein